MLHELEESKCRGDGACVDICGKRVLEVHDGKARTVESREAHCIACGQCVAICPTAALSMPSIPEDRFRPLSRSLPDFDALMSLFDARRSVRSFRPDPVSRGLLDRIVEAAGNAPMAFEPTTEVLVIDRKEELDFLRERLCANYGKLLSMHANPIGRAVIRWKRGAEAAHALESHVLKIVRDDNERAEKGDDGYLYGAPALLVFHANRWQVAYEENALISATHAALAAHALGLGATLLSIVGPCINNFPELRPRLGIPADNKVVISLIVGHPKYRFARAIRRELKSSRYL